MKITYDKNDFKVSKEEVKNVRGIKSTLKALKLAKTDSSIVTGIVITFIVNIVTSIIGALIVKNILTIITESNFDECLVYACGMFLIEI